MLMKTQEEIGVAITSELFEDGQAVTLKPWEWTIILYFSEM